ncbi:MAG: xanthine dehydrogenase family protein molybdopterin-binding subunit [Sphingomonas sp.]|uniref:molybdopterin cofactor-binding domain-containing protein n=1 Tax=Sphingomonas sp. TaxID=28214 RepID=UPI0017C83088|nr:molybdopterin cofactor-binding domain-containing protein [Sphingomonas sp.]MBA3668012.1 xanthine dehydrogenase family protein molybdopterin-binding subunit [Sphingomonas sp.]
MKLPGVSLDRRTLLIGGGAGVGLVVAFVAWPRREGTPLRPGPREGVFGPYLRIATDGRVTLAVPQVEVGQGIWTGLAQVAADELGAAWEAMGVEPAPHSGIYANRLVARDYRVTTRVTAGASSIRAFEMPLREAAAIARSMLCAAAAARWGVSAAECDTDGGFVLHEGKQLRFGDVSADAAGLSPPEHPTLRSAGAGKLVGEGLPRLDLPAKSDGGLRFAADVRLPRMVFASVRMAPPGGRLNGFSRGAARRQAGLIDLVVRENWIAAIGQSWWAADRALQRSEPIFNGPAHAGTTEIDARLAELLDGGSAKRLFERGDYDKATQGSRPLAATYAIAATPHHSLEAPAAVARFSGDRLEIWTGTQAPDLARRAAAKAAGLGEREVTLYPMPVGDGSGRAVEIEAVAIAVELAKVSGRPVSLALPPATAQTQDPVRPPLLARLAALPAPDGTIAAWSARLVGMAGLEASLARALGKGAPAFAPRGAVPSYGIPAIRIDAVSADLPIRVGYMRGGDAAMMTFLTESFVDEMARALGAEPLAYRIGMLGGAPRLARAVTTAAAIGGWDGGAPGSSMGLACASLDGSHVGLMVNASIGANQRIKVGKMTAAVDAGRIVNPDLVRQQVEGGLIAALAAASVPAPEFAAGMPRATPLRGRGFERLHEVPEIEVELLHSGEAPGGISSLGMAVLAPAVANAIAAVSGKRLRSLPFDPMAVA